MIHKPRICKGCQREYVPTGPRQDFHSTACREGWNQREKIKAGGGDPGRLMAQPPSGDSAARKLRGAEQQQREDDRERSIGDRLRDALADVARRSEAPAGEGIVLERIRVIGKAKRAQEWTELEQGLLDLAAAAIAWSVRIGHSEEGERLPVPASVLPEPDPAAEDSENGDRPVALRYADILLDAAERDLDGSEARSTIERLLGVGL